PGEAHESSSAPRRPSRSRPTARCAAGPPPLAVANPRPDSRGNLHASSTKACGAAERNTWIVWQLQRSFGARQMISDALLVAASWYRRKCDVRLRVQPLQKLIESIARRSAREDDHAIQRRPLRVGHSDKPGAVNGPSVPTRGRHQAIEAYGIRLLRPL